ncbi:MAG: hypothetical protein CHACPFDD_02670 [Phycisphaerae bacterium]|nr:hypothetical protein [Phycisphaerae bacterium]
MLVSTQRCRRVVRIAGGALLGVVVGAAGCRTTGDAAGRVRRAESNGRVAHVQRSEDEIRRDPLAFLRRVRERCGALQQYTLLFTRIERRGLFNTLHGPEHIRCWYRRSPFSVRMLWLDPDVKYGESVYVAGDDGDRVRFVPRYGLLGLPPLVTKVDLMTPVIWGEAKRPLNEWGLERLLDATLRSYEEARPHEAPRVEYRGVAALPAVERVARDDATAAATGDDAAAGAAGDDVVVAAAGDGARPVHWFRISYTRPADVASVQDLYIDVETGLPAGTLLSFADGRLDAAYYYDGLDTRVTLRDEDFRMSIERDRRPNRAASSPVGAERRAN